MEGLNPRDFRRLATFIEGTAGIRMPPTKKALVEGRLRRRLRALSLNGFDQYCAFVFDQGGLDEEAVHLIDAVTTNKTEFFREPGHFDFVVSHVLPALVEGQGRGHSSPFRAWSAASSTGAEVYTLAMLLAEYALDHPDFSFELLASDICTKVLEVAAQAIYPEDMSQPIPPPLRRRYLMRSRDRKRAEVRVIPDLRRHVRFVHLNLMDTTYPVPRDFDVIFCRNILIYFDKPTQEAVLRRLVGHLRRGGVLFVGHSETVAGGSLGLRPLASAVYLKE